MAVSDVSKDVFVKIIKKASKEGLKRGLIKADIHDNVASGLADQYAFAYELIAKGAKITPEKLSIALIEKGIGIARMGSAAERYQCGLAAAIVGIGFFKSFRAAAAAAATEGALTPLFLCETAELIEKVYQMDKKCGLSRAVKTEVMKRTEPAYMWFENGIIAWIGAQGMTRFP
ncbi:hypothetical protein [Methylobacterium sp. J-090]|uniref:hypothetical protein n=1 Tax=Methylobacterium sp. J-090 TaxID=2836666 RepID=UPI001FBB02CE|nr:hypothetical protein [Methylobacterium sp. J-090]MCJ2081700.1 hypothetical protein [Methylobacterium sp. J-090]